jgi:hypothetical protein
VGEKPAKASRKRPAVEQDSGDDDVGARQPHADPSATPSVAAEDALSREQTRRYECSKVSSIVTLNTKLTMVMTFDKFCQVQKSS